MTFPPTLFPSSPHEPALTRDTCCFPRNSAEHLKEMTLNLTLNSYTLPPLSTMLLRHAARYTAVPQRMKQAYPTLDLLSPSPPTPPWPTAEPHPDGCVSDEQPRQGREDIYASKRNRKNVPLCPTIPSFHSKDPIPALDTE